MTEEEILAILKQARDEGGAEYAAKIADKIAAIRVKDNTTSERGQMEQRWRNLGQTDPLFPPKDAAVQGYTQIPFTDAGFNTPKLLSEIGIALDYGLEAAPYGVTQLAANLEPGATNADAINREIQDREMAWERGGLSESVPANIARFTGEGVSYALPGASTVKGLRATNALVNLPSWMTGVAEGGAAGLAEGLTMPVAGDDYASGKLAQVGLAGTLGAAIPAALQGGGAAVQNTVNNTRRVRNLPGELASRADDQFAREGARLSESTGVQLTPGQQTGQPALQFLEQRARESMLSSNKAAAGDLIRANQFSEYVKNLAGDANSESFATNLQGRIKNFVIDLAGQRSKTGRQMYGEIERFARGEKIVQPRNVYDELTAIIEEAGTQEGGDVVKAAQQARKMLETIDAQGGYSAKEALARLQNWSPYSKGSVFDDVNIGYDKVLKRRVYNALMKDLDEVAANGSTLGDMVGNANKMWRTYSEQIDAVQMSALGKMVGEDIATDILEFNRLSPEQVMDMFSRMRPSQAKYVANFLEDHMPDQLPKLRGSILSDAFDAAMEMPATGGARPEMNPAGFLRALGLTGNKRGGEAYQRLMHLFGGESSADWSMLRDAIDVARRMSDATGKNFSGTSQANQFYQLLRDLSGSVTSLLRRAGSTTLEAGGLRRITDYMNPNGLNYGNISPTQLLNLQPRVRRLSAPASVLGSGSGAAVIGEDGL